MAGRNPWSSYKQVAAQTASPGHLVLMLFDGAIRFLERARLGFEIEDPSERIECIHNNITRAQDIIHELNMSLNMEEGGEFAACMRRLYTYLDKRLFESNMNKEPSGIDEALQRLGTIRDAWRQMLQGETEAAPQNLAA
ncbi:MAG TPA: flagellar export chaperone FliS [Methylomirabilota bacterium]|nr:flagellar export chaperone FliS [Methylomirabilota bacterium]